ncbi:MAG: hypothetical protein J5I41_02240 [Saprospiraceae bacterium]|nr:hypothetical protein [Saprospiraceae bacterium]
MVTENMFVRKNLLAVAGYCALTGAICMLVGAACWGATGTDLWVALARNDIDTWLSQLESARSLLVVNTSFWVAGVVLMAAAGKMMSGLTSRSKGMAALGHACTQTGAAVAIVAFLLMLAPAVHLAPDTSAEAVRLAGLIGWTGARLDDLATLLIIGAGPLLLSIAGDKDWVPGWLRIWGYLAGGAGLVAILTLFNPGHPEPGFLIVPVGIGWMIAAGIVLIRAAKRG